MYPQYSGSGFLMNFQILGLQSTSKDFPEASLKPSVLQMVSAQRNEDGFKKKSKIWYHKHFKLSFFAAYFS